MKIKPILLGLTALIAPLSLMSDSNYDFVCNYGGGRVNSAISIQPSTDLANKRVAAIVDEVGLEKNFSVLAANVDNASALVKGSHRYILYNPQFMQTVRNTAGFDWTSYSILAHEIGHHLNGHTIQAGGSRPEIELEADEFSGFVLRRMGASLTEAQAAMKIIATPHGSSTHPGKTARLAAIKRGWEKGA
jgi:hypothetical protein